MSQYEKLVERIKKLDKNLRFNEIKNVLQKMGYEMKSPSGGSSHMTFRKAGYSSITIPTHEPIKKIYVSMVKEALENEEDNEQDA